MSSTYMITFRIIYYMVSVPVTSRIFLYMAFRFSERKKFILNIYVVYEYLTYIRLK